MAYRWPQEAGPRDFVQYSNPRYPEPCPQNEVTNQVWIFDPTARAGRRWKRGPNLTMARGYVTPAVVGNKLYAIGGDIWDETESLLVPVTRVEAVKNVLGGGKFHRRADLPEPCDESQAFGFKRGDLGGHIILAGCGQWPNAIPDSFDYDIVRNSWSNSAPLNEARRNHAGFRSPRPFPFNMFVLGGYGGDGQIVLQSSESSIPALRAASASGRTSKDLSRLRWPGTY